MDNLALVFTELNKMEVKNIAIPTPVRNQVLIRVKACGICGTDLHILKGNYDSSIPLVPGHECSGEIVALGPDVVSRKVGDRVVVDPNIECGHCEFCKSGRVHLCKNLKPFGVFRDGGFEQYAVIEETHALPMPENMTFLQGALVEPVSCCIRGSQMARFKIGDSVLIHGAGAIGLLNMQIARNCGCAIVGVSDPISARREKALSLGADFVIDPIEQNLMEIVHQHCPDGPDVVMECAGKTKLVEEAVMQVKRGGIVVAFGCCPPGEYARISPDYINNNEITICGSFNNPVTSQTAITEIASGRINVDAVVSHRFKIKDAEKAFATFGTPDSLKIVIEP